MSKENEMVRKHVSEIRAGDSFVDPETGLKHWTAIGDAKREGDEVIVAIQWKIDGARGPRVWDYDAVIPIAEGAEQV